MPQVSLFLANLKADLIDDGKLREHMEKYGTVERCFVMRNPSGENKVSWGDKCLGARQPLLWSLVRL